MEGNCIPKPHTLLLHLLPPRTPYLTCYQVAARIMESWGLLVPWRVNLQCQACNARKDDLCSDCITLNDHQKVLLHYSLALPCTVIYASVLKKKKKKPSSLPLRPIWAFPI